jgi:acyl-CoA synthetase (NDP forming)
VNILPPAGVLSILQNALNAKRQSLLEPEAKAICRAYGMPTPQYGVAKSPSEAADLAERVKFPVVLKIVSQDILHKTEANGVLLNLGSRKETEEGYGRVIANVRAYRPDARIEGVLVQHMEPKGLEVIVGGLRDSQFSPTVLFGLGGIFVEVLKDVAFRVAPLNELDSKDMIREIHSYPVLKGLRGQPPADETAIRKILQETSRMMMENPSIEQIDLNPIMVYGKGASIVDSRIILSRPAEPS